MTLKHRLLDLAREIEVNATGDFSAYYALGVADEARREIEDIIRQAEKEVALAELERVYAGTGACPVCKVSAGGAVGNGADGRPLAGGRAREGAAPVCPRSFVYGDGRRDPCTYGVATGRCIYCNKPPQREPEAPSNTPPEAG